MPHAAMFTALKNRGKKPSPEPISEPETRKLEPRTAKGYMYYMYSRICQDLFWGL